MIHPSLYIVWLDRFQFSVCLLELRARVVDKNKTGLDDRRLKPKAVITVTSKNCRAQCLRY